MADHNDPNAVNSRAPPTLTTTSAFLPTKVPASPEGPRTSSNNRLRKGQNGNIRFVYSGEDAGAGQNGNAIILECRLHVCRQRLPGTESSIPDLGRKLRIEGLGKVETIPDDPPTQRSVVHSKTAVVS